MRRRTKVAAVAVSSIVGLAVLAALTFIPLIPIIPDPRWEAQCKVGGLLCVIYPPDLKYSVTKYYFGFGAESHDGGKIHYFCDSSWCDDP